MLFGGGDFTPLSGFWGNWTPAEKVADLVFNLDPNTPDTLITIDSTFIPPAGEFVFTIIHLDELELVSITPEFVEGEIIIVSDTGPAKTVLEPDTMSVYYAYGVDSMHAAVYLGNLAEGYTVNDIVPGSPVVNGDIDPLLETIIPSHPEFDGEVLKLVIDRRPFVAGYGPLWDTTTQQFTVTAQLTDGVLVEGNSDFVMIGHRSGDADGNGVVEVSDAVFLVRYIFEGGPAPRLLGLGDADCNGVIEASDVVYLVNYIFDNGPAPCRRK
jgi:hypothetical protein